jgi:hypothetical protein
MVDPRAFPDRLAVFLDEAVKGTFFLLPPNLKSWVRTERITLLPENQASGELGLHNNAQQRLHVGPLRSLSSVFWGRPHTTQNFSTL